MSIVIPAWFTRRLANGVGFALCAALIAYALYAQYVLYLEPCPLCLFQRFAIMGMGVAFLLAVIYNPTRKTALAHAILLAIFALIGIAIAAWHIYIQSLPPGSVPACGASLSYLFDIMSFMDVLKKVFSGSGECAHVDLFLGVSWPWWVVIAMTGLGAWGVITNLRLAK